MWIYRPGVMGTLQWELTRFSNRFRPGGDGLIAVALMSVMAGTSLAAGASSIALRLGGVLAGSGLLVLLERRRRPLLVLVTVFCVVFVEELLAPRVFGVGSFLAIMVAAYSLGAHASRRILAVGMVLGIPGVVIGHSLGKPTHYSDASADAFFYLILVAGPVLVGFLVRARSQLAVRLREATERLSDARAERVAAMVAADRAELSERIDTTLVEGLGKLVELGKCETLEQVTALERVAREVLGKLRGLLGELRTPEDALQPGRSISDLHARVQRAIDAEAALPDAQGPTTPVARRWALIPPRLIDRGLVLVAVTVTGGLLVDALSHAALRGPRPLDGLLALAVGTPIAWARRAPLRATATSVAASFAYIALAAPADPVSGFLPTGMLIVFPFALGATCAARTALVGLGLCLAAAGLADAVDPAAKLNATTVAPGLALAIGAWAAGRVLRDRGQMLGALAETTMEIEHERQQMAHAGRSAERARVARELHDAIAHAMTVIVLQAAAARRVWQSDSELAAQHARTLRKTVSELVTELRTLLQTLDGGYAMRPGRLEQLIERARATGLRVVLEVRGNRESLAPGSQHTAYRVLQEALTNASRHAPGAHVDVRLDFRPSGLALEVVNDIPARPAPNASDGVRQGLSGMRERVQACGGRLEVGPQVSGAFAVRAWLPCS
jgi:signal transduction histidine kinase